MFRRNRPRGRNRSARFSLFGAMAFRGRSVDRILNHKRSGRRLSVEALEDRRMLAVVTVANTLDSSNGNVASIADLIADDGGDGISLREAIEAANNTANVGGLDEVRFNIPGANVQTIQPNSALPTISDPLIVDGYTQPGASPNTNSTDSGLNSVLVIQIDGINAGNVDGLSIAASGDGSTIRGLVIGNFERDGIFIEDAAAVNVAGNYVGVASDGVTAMGNRIGVDVNGPGVVIGGLVPEARNLISGNNGNGIVIDNSDGAVIQGNLVGVDATGASAVANTGFGISLANGTNQSLVGHASNPAGRNVASGNAFDGINIATDFASENAIVGNYVGVDVSGEQDLGNSRHGISLTSAHNNTIGGLNGAGNLVAFNGGNGVNLEFGSTNDNAIVGNTIRNNSLNGVQIHDVDFIGSESTGNRITQNAIYDNALLGVDLGDDGVTANDASDVDEGPNRLQNFPEIVGTATLLGDSLAVRYSVDSVVLAADYPLTIDFYVADASGREGRAFFGSDTYAAAEAQTVMLANVPAPASLTSTSVVSTATDAAGNTSEFSLPIQIVTPVNLGSEPTVILDDEEEIVFGEVDYYQYTAHTTGKLVVRSDFIHVAGDLDLEVRDRFGNLIEASVNSSPDQDFEEIVIPVVSQEQYFIGVSGLNLPPGEPGEEESQIYDLEIENFPTPAPTGVHLDPASDTGIANNDNVTANATPRFLIQTDVLNFIDENQNGATDAEEIHVLTAAEAEEGLTAGIAVQLTLVNAIAGTSTTVFADLLIAGVPEVFQFTPAVDLDEGVYLVTARTKIFDGQSNELGDPAPAMDRSKASAPLWFTLLGPIDGGGGGAGDGVVSLDLLASSDTGMFDDDNVTANWQPAFQGIAPANFNVRLYANGDLVGQTVAGSDSSDVGIGGAGGLGGAPDDELGLWEITSEPLDDDGYDLTLEIEDAAGNVTTFDPMFNGDDQSIDIVVDKTEPNTPLLDLIDDAGRHDDDNTTKANAPRISATSSDPNAALAQLLFEDNLKFRIYDRFENTAEFLLYDSALDAAVDAVNVAGDMFTALTLIEEALPEQFFALHGGAANAAVVEVDGAGVLADGVHNLKLEVEDRAGNISRDYLLQITIDAMAPPVSFGLPAAVDVEDGLAADSDSGNASDAASFADRVTSDATPRLWGRAEPNSIVRVYLDRDADGVIDVLTDTFLGQTVAAPFDGNNAYPDGYWELTTALDLNEIVGVPIDGLRSLLVTAEDVAGNPMPMAPDEDPNNPVIENVDQLDIFIDTQGPQVADVAIPGFDFDLFDPKPSVNGPTPLIESLAVSFEDLPNRAATEFLYEALFSGTTEQPGVFRLTGDHVGTIAIDRIRVINDAPMGGAPATATVTLTFVEPLPDDRYTFTIADAVTDPTGNRLDGESNASEPLDDPIFNTGDGVPGGDFVVRFTVDSRPEIASYIPQGINIDVNGNFVWDPQDQLGDDQANVDLTFSMGVADPATGAIAPGGFGVHDLVFAGRFAPQIVMEYENGEFGRVGDGSPSGFDQLAVFGNAQDLGAFRWLIDTNSDGIVNVADGDVVSIQQLQAGFDVAGAIPVAGNFDRNAENGDEIGLYKAGVWVFDTDRDFVVETNGDDTVITSTLLGHPIVGDFDGDDADDLGVFNNNVWNFDFAFDGLGVTNDGLLAADVDGVDRDDSLVWGFPGVLDRPVAADMDQDGVDDIGLWVPRSGAQPPQAVAEWHFLVSNDPVEDDGGENEGGAEAHALGTIEALDHPFEPVPFGFDLYAEFGFERGLPLVGNFDPPVADSNSSEVEPSEAFDAADFTRDGQVDGSDFLRWQRGYGKDDSAHTDGDANGDALVDGADLAVWEGSMQIAVANAATVKSNTAAVAETIFAAASGDAVEANELAPAFFVAPNQPGKRIVEEANGAELRDAALARDLALRRFTPSARTEFDTLELTLSDQESRAAARDNPIESLAIAIEDWSAENEF